MTYESEACASVPQRTAPHGSLLVEDSPHQPMEHAEQDCGALHHRTSSTRARPNQGAPPPSDLSYLLHAGVEMAERMLLDSSDSSVRSAWQVLKASFFLPISCSIGNCTAGVLPCNNPAESTTRLSQTRMVNAIEVDLLNKMCRLRPFST